MANNLTTSVAAKNAMINALTALLNAGGAGTVSYYTGAQPTSPDTAISTQALLATDTFSVTAFGPASGGQAAANSIVAGTVVANGTVAWARCYSGAGTAVIDLTVGTSSCDITVGTTSVATGTTIPIQSFTLTHN